MITRYQADTINQEMVAHVDALIHLVAGDDAADLIASFHSIVSAIDDVDELSYTIETTRRHFDAIYRAQQILTGDESCS